MKQRPFPESKCVRDRESRTILRFAQKRARFKDTSCSDLVRRPVVASRFRDRLTHEESSRPPHAQNASEDHRHGTRNILPEYGSLASMPLGILVTSI